MKDKLGLSVSSFWLEYFAFPLVDNAYINSEQRYSVVLDEFKASPDGEDLSVKITLLYYPASYAGLKEKSFYNNKLMDYLMRQDFFKDTK